MAPGAVGFEGDVNIREVGGVVLSSGEVPVTFSGPITISGPLEVIQDTHDDLNANANIQVGNVDVANGNPVPVSDAGGSLTIDGTVAVGPTVTPGTGATNLGKAEDSPHATGHVGVMPLAVRNDSTVALAGANFDYIPFSTDSVGRLRTTVGTAVSLEATVTENAVVSGGHSVFPAGVVRDDSLATLGVADNDWTNLRVSDRGALWVLHDGDVEVVQPTRTDLLCNASLQLQGTDIVAGGALGVTRTQRIPVSEYGSGGLPNLYFNLAGVVEVPGSVIIDPSAIRSAGVNNGMGGSGTSGALKTGPDRDTIVQLHNAQVFNNVTTSANGTAVDVLDARWLMVYIDLTESGNPTNIRLIAQFSTDGGTTWFDYAVDQWVDLRYIDPQMPLKEAVPINYVCGSDFRLQAVATGTTASDTFTLSAWVEAVS